MAKFKPGQSGNPAGRPSGSFAVARRIRERLESSGDVDMVIAGIVDAARKGDMTALCWLGDRFFVKPKPTAEPVTFPMPSDADLAGQARAVLEAASKGELSVDTASQAISALGGIARVAEVDELRRRLETIEGKLLK